MKKSYAFVTAGVLLLSACASNPSTQRPNVVMNAQGVPSHYLVRQGDTVSQIAQRYKLSWQEVARLNRLDGSNTIYAGQWLKLWQGSATQNSQKAVTQTNASATPAPSRVVIATPTKATTTQTPNPQKSTNLQDAGHFVYPVDKSASVVRQFGTMRQVNGAMLKTEGTWFSAKEGSPVTASRAGTVIYADVNSIPDASIAIRHADGFITEYRFIKDTTVKAGQNVVAGQPIASVKSTGGVAVMEFRVVKNNLYIDPMTVLR